MKILMSGLLPVDLDAVKGGVVSVIINLLDGFAELNDIEICHVSFNQEIKEQITHQYKKNIKIRYIPFKSKFSLIDYLVNRKKIDSIIKSERPDLIHIQEITPQLIRFMHLQRSLIIVTQHGIMKEDIKNAKTLLEFLKKSFKALIELFLYPKFRNIVFISNYNSQFFSGLPAHSTLIPNPVNQIFFDEQVPIGKLNSILFVAAISENKNLQLLLQAIGELKKRGAIFEVNVIGGFKNAQLERYILHLVTELDICNQITFHGWRTQPQILELHHHSSILVLSSNQESMPVVVAEAMSTGKVVVASNVGAISEMITDGETGFLFPKNNLEKLVSILERLYLNEKLIFETSLKAKQEARRKFHPISVALQTKHFYQEVFNSSKK